MSDATKDRIGATIRLLLHDALLFALVVFVGHVLIGWPLDYQAVASMLLTLLVLSRWDMAGFMQDVGARAREIREALR